MSFGIGPLLSVIQKIRFEDFEKIDNGGISKKTSIIRDNQGRLVFYKIARIAKILNEQRWRLGETSIRNWYISCDDAWYIRQMGE